MPDSFHTLRLEQCLICSTRLCVSIVTPRHPPHACGLGCRYIVSKCHELVERVTAGLESYDTAEAGSLINTFLWDEYADW